MSPIVQKPDWRPYWVIGVIVALILIGGAVQFLLSLF